MRCLLPSFLVALAGCGAIVGIQPLDYRPDPDSSAPTDPPPPTAPTQPDVVTVAPDALSTFDCDGATFCDSFERSQPKGEWDSAFVEPGSVLECTGARARTGRSSLRSLLGDSNLSKAFVSKAFPAPRHLRWAFSFVFDAIPARSAEVGALKFESGGDALGFSARFGEGQLAVFFEDPILRGLVLRPIPIGKWIDVLLVIDLRSSPQRFSLTIDGVRHHVDTAIPVSVPLAPVAVTVTAGATQSAAGPPIAFDIDDVRVDIEP